MMRFFLLALLFLSTSALALEVDEKLTVRIVKTSESRKTVMVNRGTEDGLVEGDHAKFIVTAGIVARGVVIKVSPTRSVWSIYRLVNADFIVNDSVMTIKISPAVKVTKDETQAIVQEDTPTRPSKNPAELGIPLAEGAQDLSPAAEAEGESIASLDDTPVSLVDKNFEVVGLINISGLTASSKVEEGEDSFNNSQSNHHIGLGGEWYARREREWYSRFSLIGSINLMRLNSQAYNGAASTNDVTEFSIGTNWHFSKLPSVVYEFIPFVHLSAHMGSVKSTFSPGTNASGGDEFSSTGSTGGYALGFGYKYYVSRGFGARALLDYYMRTEKYKADTPSNNVHNKVVGGPRLMMAISYRF